MDEQTNAPALDAAAGGVGGDEIQTSGRNPRWHDDPESWHDLAERGTPRNG